MSHSEWKSSYDDDGDRFAGIKKTLARIFGDGENPLAWGFPFARIAGTRYKIHILMVVYLLAQLIFTLPGHKAGPIFVVPNLIALVLLVLLHELAHTYVAKRNGAQSDQRMLWPLGGLEPATFEDPSFKAELRTVLAGPALHLALLPIFVLPLVLLTESWDPIIFNPFSPSTAIPSLMLKSTATTPWWLVTIWAFHVVNLILLLANLIPMLPLDAGAILRIALTPKLGDLGARHQTAIVGLILATILGLVGIVFTDAKLLLAIAIVAGIVCNIERRRLQFLNYAHMVPGFSPSTTTTPEKPPRAPKPDPATPDQDQLDQILAQISESGIDSLSRKQRAILKKATESSRNSEEAGKLSK